MCLSELVYGIETLTDRARTVVTAEEGEGEVGSLGRAASEMSRLQCAVCLHHVTAPQKLTPPSFNSSIVFALTISF